MCTRTKYPQIVLALFAFFFVPRLTVAQVWIEPHAGWLVPTKDLGRTDVLSNSGYGVFERAEPSAVLGLGAGVDLGDRWAIRASVDRSLNAAVHGEWQCVPFVACLGVLLPLDGELSFWNAAIDAMYRFPTNFPLNPVVSAGLGLRRSELDWNQLEVDVMLPAFSFDETRVVYRLGAGFEYLLGSVTIFGEVEATAVRFGGGSYESIEGNVDADRVLSVDTGLVGGVRFRLR